MKNKKEFYIKVGAYLKKKYKPNKNEKIIFDAWLLCVEIEDASECLNSAETFERLYEKNKRLKNG